MTLTRNLLACFALFFATASAFAAAPATNSAPATPTKPDLAKFKNSSARAVSGLTPTEIGLINAPATADSDTLPQKIGPETTVKLDSYIKDLTAELKLSDSEAKEITSYYVADGDKLQQLLNDDTLSPLQQAQQTADLREARNEKIEELLHDFQRQRDFYKVEAKYRVALTELAADGGLVAPPAPAPAPAPPAAK
jgi:hypothetical protein